MVVRPKFKVRDGEQIITLEGNPVQKKRDYIVDFLRQRGDAGAFVMEMFRGWKQLCESVGRKFGTYESFRQAMYQAKLDGIVEPFREVPGITIFRLFTIE